MRPKNPILGRKGRGEPVVLARHTSYSDSDLEVVNAYLGDVSQRFSGPDWLCERGAGKN
jgi:hypothetical protein